MDDILLQSRLNTPIRTGAAGLTGPAKTPRQDAVQAQSFRDVLEGLQKKDSRVTFSKAVYWGKRLKFWNTSPSWSSGTSGFPRTA
jgi:hypothetical protein